jgi:hypothetical protein
MGLLSVSLTDEKYFFFYKNEFFHSKEFFCEEEILINFNYKLLTIFYQFSSSFFSLART